MIDSSVYIAARACNARMRSRGDALAYRLERAGAWARPSPKRAGRDGPRQFSEGV